MSTLDLVMRIWRRFLWLVSQVFLVTVDWWFLPGSQTYSSQLWICFLESRWQIECPVIPVWYLPYHINMIFVILILHLQFMCSSLFECCAVDRFFLHSDCGVSYCYQRFLCKQSWAKLWNRLLKTNSPFKRFSPANLHSRLIESFDFCQGTGTSPENYHDNENY